MISGTTVLSAPNSISHAPAASLSIPVITLSNMILDEMYASRKILAKFNWEIPKDWDWDTMLHAYFHQNTSAGNIEYSRENVQKIKIKKRYKGEFNWKTIYEQDIHTAEDFNIELYDYFEPSNREIEYSYVAVVSNVDMNATSAGVHSEFECYFICDHDVSYPILFDANHSVTYNRNSQIIVSPGRKYPYVNHNGIAKYYSGTMNATFFLTDEHCGLDTKNSDAYRKQIDEFLTNGKAKILKSFSGDMWMIQTSGSISRSVNSDYRIVSQQFDWTECGDPDSIGDLYDNGFIDTDTDRE